MNEEPRYSKSQERRGTVHKITLGDLEISWTYQKYARASVYMGEVFLGGHGLTGALRFQKEQAAAHLVYAQENLEKVLEERQQHLEAVRAELQEKLYDSHLKLEAFKEVVKKVKAS